eukprot:2899233-Pyramimonas_sp.AAC.1
MLEADRSAPQLGVCTHYAASGPTGGNFYGICNLSAQLGGVGSAVATWSASCLLNLATKNPIVSRPLDGTGSNRCTHSLSSAESHVSSAVPSAPAEASSRHQTLGSY